MTEISEIPAVNQDVEAGVQNIGITRAIVVSNGIASDEEQTASLLRALGLNRKGMLLIQRPSKRPKLWFIRWLPNFIYNKFPDLSWFSRSISLPVSIPYGPLATKDFAHASQIVEKARDEFASLGPLLVIGSGRDTVSTTRFIKKSAPNHVFVVHIQYPDCDFKMFDFVVLPEYEYYIHSWFPRWWARKPGNNVHLTVGVMHAGLSNYFGTAADNLKHQLRTLVSPFLLVIIGEPTENCPYDEDVIRQLSGDLLRVYRSCGSIRIYISRTTPQKFIEILDRDFKDDGNNNDKFKIWNGQNPDPYVAYLQHANAIVVTADSIRMLSHACSTGRPVYVVGDQHCTLGHKEFLKQLMKLDAIKRFSECQNISETWTYHPLRDAVNAASALHRAYQARKW